MNTPATSYMYDTSPEMREYQKRLIMSKTPEERFIMGIRMSETGRELMLAGIKHAKPGLSDEEYKIELLRRMILYDKTLEWLAEQLP